MGHEGSANLVTLDHLVHKLLGNGHLDAILISLRIDDLVRNIHVGGAACDDVRLNGTS